MYSLALIAHEVSVTMKILLVAAALVSASLASEAEDALQFARFRGQFGKQYHTRYSAVQYSTVQYSTVQYSTVPRQARVRTEVRHLPRQPAALRGAQPVRGILDHG